MGESTWDLARVFLVPATVDFEAGNSNGMTGSSNTTPAGWIDVCDGKLKLKADWQSASRYLVIDNAAKSHFVVYW